MEKELFIHYSIALKIFPPYFSIIFECQSVRIEHNILHHVEARKLRATQKFTTEQKVRKFQQIGTAEMLTYASNWDYYRTNVNEIILSIH